VSNTTIQTISATGWTAVTGCAATVTTDATSKVLLIANLNAQGTAANTWGAYTFLRNSVDFTGNANGLNFGINGAAGENVPVGLNWIDTPGAGTWTYAVAARRAGPSNIDVKEGTPCVINAIELLQ
jgi:hypothetical protein